MYFILYLKKKENRKCIGINGIESQVILHRFENEIFPLTSVEVHLKPRKLCGLLSSERYECKLFVARSAGVVRDGAMTFPR